MQRYSEIKETSVIDVARGALGEEGARLFSIAFSGQRVYVPTWDRLSSRSRAKLHLIYSAPPAIPTRGGFQAIKVRPKANVIYSAPPRPYIMPRVSAIAEREGQPGAGSKL